MPKQGQIVDRSNSGGLGVLECWTELFDRNEKFWKTGKVEKILTDDQILQQMRKWFPHRHALKLTMVSRTRGTINRRKKFVAAFRYMRDSEGAVCRATNRGIPMSEWKMPGPKSPF